MRWYHQRVGIDSVSVHVGRGGWTSFFVWICNFIFFHKCALIPLIFSALLYVCSSWTEVCVQ